jgi:hypothetical protein
VIVERNTLSDDHACTSLFSIEELDQRQEWHNSTQSILPIVTRIPKSMAVDVSTLFLNLKASQEKITSRKSISFVGPVELAESPEGSFRSRLAGQIRLKFPRCLPSALSNPCCPEQSHAIYPIKFGR